PCVTVLLLRARTMTHSSLYLAHDFDVLLPEPAGFNNDGPQLAFTLGCLVGIQMFLARLPPFQLSVGADAESLQGTLVGLHLRHGSPAKQKAPWTLPRDEDASIGKRVL